MTIIKTKQDWIDLARKTLPKLSDYAREHGRQFEEEKAIGLLDRGMYLSLHSILQSLWMRLPDHRDIRHGPFFDLCDLCSEDWVFHEVAAETPDDDDDPPPVAA